MNSLFAQLDAYLLYWLATDRLLPSSAVKTRGFIEEIS